MSDFKLFVPIAKVNQEKRTVAGWATSEVIDKQNEIVDYSASKAAFADWKGNIREMHEPRAVGKAVEIIPDDDQKKVWVEAYVSKGAEDTWQKIKEGILTGFSIGGQTIDKVVQVVKDTSTQASRQVSRITKYRLNELSLVDNPANPESSFALVKRDSKTGDLRQTELVEDTEKIAQTYTEGEDLLKCEVQDYKERAESLEKKVISVEALQDLPDASFGVIRKYEDSNGRMIKERILAMPDKVHAHAVLKKMVKYNLTNEEREQVHGKAKEMLGTSHKEEECTLCKMTSQTGGINIDMSLDAEMVQKLADAISKLTEKVDAVLKGEWTGAHAPVAGSKTTPKQEEGHETVGEPHAAAGMDTQNPDGSYPAKGPVKAADAMPEEVKDKIKAKEEEDKTEKANMTSGDSNLQTQDPKGAYPAKGPIKAADAAAQVESKVEDKEDGDEEEVKVPAEKAAKKSDESTDLKKLTETVKSLQKKVEELDTKPLPRKYKVEKTFGTSDTEETNTEGEALTKEYDAVRAAVQESIQTGKALSPEMEKRRSALLNKSLDGKFGQEIKKA